MIRLAATVKRSMWDDPLIAAPYRCQVGWAPVTADHQNGGDPSSFAAGSGRLAAMTENADQAKGGPGRYYASSGDPTGVGFANLPRPLRRRVSDTSAPGDCVALECILSIGTTV